MGTMFNGDVESLGEDSWQAQFVGALSPDVKLGTRNSWKFGIINSGLLVVSPFSCSPLLCLQHLCFFAIQYCFFVFLVRLRGI